MKKGKKRLYLWLLGIHMFISAFTFGGGYVVVPMIRKYFVLQKKMFGGKTDANALIIAPDAPATRNPVTAARFTAMAPGAD